MKRISILSLLCCLFALGSYAATLSGTVTNTTTSQPVSGQKVYVFDSLGFWSDSALTNTSGGYTFTVPSTVPNGDLIMAYTAGCNNVRAWWTAFYAGSNMTANFSTCGSSSISLHGTVSLSGVSNNGQAKLYLIRKTYDSLAATYILTAIDSFLTASTGGTYSRNYSGIPQGQLLLKAALLSTHPSYAGYLPTYYSGSASWSGATTLTSANFGVAATNINMIAGTNPGGPGFIGGDVLLGANKTSGAGDPLSGRILILVNASNQPVAYTYSDASGHFEFRNVALGTYKIYGDVWGKTNPALTLSLTNAVQRVSNIVFEENSSNFTGRIGNLGAGAPAALAALKVYPNPVNAFVAVDGLASVKGDKTVVIRSMTGAVISSQTVSTASLRIATDALPAGMYLLQVVTAAGDASFRFVK